MPEESPQRQKFRHTQTVATTSLMEAVEIAKDEAFSHYGSIGTDVQFDDEEPVIEILVKVRGTYVPNEVMRENQQLKAQVDSQRALLAHERAKLSELQAQLPPPAEPSP